MPSCSATQVVALLGVTGSGKSVVARRLLASGFQRLRFSDPLRDMLAAGFGCSVHELDGDLRDKPQKRFGWQSVNALRHTLANDWGRFGIHTDIWTMEWQRRLGLLSGRVLADDLRHPCEAAAVRDAGGIIVRITRPDFKPPRAGDVQRQATISADIELTNHGRDKFAEVADQFARSLDEQLDHVAA